MCGAFHRKHNHQVSKVCSDRGAVGNGGRGVVAIVKKAELRCVARFAAEAESESCCRDVL